MRIARGFLALFILAFIVGFGGSLVFDFLHYPECYIPTWKYQLENDLRNGKENAVEYYERVYKSNDRDLFGDNFEIIQGAE